MLKVKYVNYNGRLVPVHTHCIKGNSTKTIESHRRLMQEIGSIELAIANTTGQEKRKLKKKLRALKHNLTRYGI